MDGRKTWRRRLRQTLVQGRRLHTRYHRLFWTLHSIWALLTGVVVLILAHNRYGFVPWVVLFLLLTWATTLLFSRRQTAAPTPRWALARGFVSYLTRVMYQETLFFLIPFYSYSTTFPSPNTLFLATLALLAVFSCLDLPFDRLLRKNRLFAMTFFGLVTFSALNLLLPLLFQMRVHHAPVVAAAAAFVASVPLAHRWHELRQGKLLLRIGAAFLAAIAVATVARPLVPPVPLRLVRLNLTAAADPLSTRPEDELGESIRQSNLAGGSLVAVATVFAPERLPASVVFRFLRDGETIRTSQVVEVEAHRRGFRVHDRLDFGELLPPAGRYRVEIWTKERHLVGRRTIEILPDNVPNPP